MRTADSITLALKPLHVALVRAGVVRPTRQPRSWVLNPVFVAEFLTIYNGYSP